MSKLEVCHTLWGSDRIVKSAPSTTTINNAFYLPYVHKGLWGVFTSAGDIAADAVDFRGVDRSLNDQIIDTDLTIDDIHNRAEHSTYFYAGRVYNHYGHFLVNTLPRFWSVLSQRPKNMPILCHASGSPIDWFRIPFLDSVFSALELQPSDFAFIEEPQRIDSIVIPRTSFEEQRSAHMCYGEFCRSIGAKLIDLKNIGSNQRPIYFSKSQLKAGVGAVINEAEIEEVLVSMGVDICYPEQLTLQDQIRTIMERDIVLGTAGSFLHTTLFTGAKRIGCINVQQQINTNFSMIDKVSGSTATYYYPPAIEVVRDRQEFLTARYLPDARDVAKEFYQTFLHEVSQSEQF